MLICITLNWLAINRTLGARVPGEKTIMKCLICKMGETSAGNVTVTLQRGELTVLIKNVPAEVCENCGEYYLSDEITDKVLKQAQLSAANNAEVEILRFAA